MIHLTDFTVIVGIIISLILIVLLTKSRNRGLDKNVLITIFCFIFFTILHTYASLNEIRPIYYLSFLFDYSLFWILGPLLLLYIKALFINSENLLRKNIFHFYPVILLIIIVFIPKVITEAFSEVTLGYIEFYKKNQLVFIILRNTYFIIYLLFSLELFLKLKSSALSEKQNLSIEEYGWINRLVLGSLIFVALDTFVRSFELFVFKLQFDGGFFTLFLLIAFVIYLGYHSLNESRILIPAFLFQNSLNGDMGFSEEEIVALELKIKDTLENEKLYLDETLNLKSLSEALHISDKKLSAFLNNHFNTKFKDYINLYRVEEVKEKLKSDESDKFTLLGIAYECGFNSKASFYRIFKKHTGFSPSQYKKEIRKVID